MDVATGSLCPTRSRTGRLCSGAKAHETPWWQIQPSFVSKCREYTKGMACARRISQNNRQKAAQRLLKPHRVSTNPLATACAGPQRTPQASGPGGAPELARGAPRPLPRVLWLPSPQGKRLRGSCRRHTFSFLLFSLPTHFVVLRGLQAADGIAFRPLGLPMVVPHRPPRQVGLAAISHSQADSMLSTFLRLCLLLSLPLLDPQTAEKTSTCATHREMARLFPTWRQICAKNRGR